MDPGTARSWVEAFAAAVLDRADELTALDAAIGDADHGTNLARGAAAVLSALAGDASDDAVLTTTGMTLVTSVGGAAGPLYGTFFLRAGASLRGGADLADVFAAGVDGVAARGRAAVGDATMIDALVPARDALTDALRAGLPEERGVADAVAAARSGSDATLPLVPRLGRASYLGERAVGHRDPGAASAVLLVEALAAAAGGAGGGTAGGAA